MDRILIAQNYNCSDSNVSAYGAGAYNTCANTTSTDTTQTDTIGAPNTGEFFGLVTTGAFSVLLPLIITIVIVTAASIAMIRRKRATTQR